MARTRWPPVLTTLRVVWRNARRCRTDLHAAAVDQDEPVAVLRELERESRGDPTAEGVPDDRGAGVPERGEQVTDAGGVAAERVVGPGRRGGPVSEQVRAFQKEIE